MGSPSRADRINLAAALALTFTTGMVDAIGYLGLDRVFTANMTGNVVILAIGLTGTSALPVAGPMVAMVGFFLGAAFAGRWLRGAAPGWHTRTTISLVATGTVVIAISAGVRIWEPVLGSPWALAVTAIIGIAMGGQATTARRLAVSDVPTVVVTATLTNLAADSPLGAGTNQRWRRRAGAVAFLALGAAVGALLLQVSLPVSLAATGALIVATAIWADRTHLRGAAR